jgi:glucose/arabinose dehydrogenase
MRGEPPKHVSRSKLCSVGLAMSAILFSLIVTPPVCAETLPSLDALRVAAGLGQVLFVTAPPQDYGRLFIVRQTGQVHILNLATGILNPTPFLDIQARLTATNGEQGLLGMAFDPNYAANGKFYLNFTVPGGEFGNGTTHISQFKVSANPDVADTSDEKILKTFDHPQANHNGGWIGFSPRIGDENNLYIATGDGGNGDDVGPGHLEPGGNAQNTTTLLGKMLRLHVDSATGTASIPPNNPFVGSKTARPEIFTYGLRNPFRASFDRLNGTLFIGDVGQNTREEVDVQKPGNPGGGENYGWRVREGLIQNPDFPNDTPPPNAVDPILDYPRSTGGTVAGGYVYRGQQIPRLRGIYIFGDYLSSSIFSLNYDGKAASNFQTITSDLFPTATGGFTLSGPASLGEDANGEIYICAINTGSVFKIVPTTPNIGSTAVAKRPGGGVVVSAVGVPFQVHTVQATNTLVEPFANIGAAPAAGNGVVKFDDIAPGTQRFYRFTYP